MKKISSLSDNFVLIPTYTNPFSLFSIVSKIDYCIQFSIEVENSCLPFLDVSVYKHKNQLSTTPFIKCFAVSLSLHALSIYSPEQKMSGFYFFVFRALHLCSNLSDLSCELNYFKFVAVSQGCNPSIIVKVSNNLKNNKLSACLSNKPCCDSVGLPFYSSISFRFSIILSHFIFKVCFKSANKIKVFPHKNHIPSENWREIYLIPCSSCHFGILEQTR